ncbi:MAG: imidazolonepropionase [Saprospiraceae bacterium]|nr:imidazolonepropionase [Saprospiraceae bacterium]
MLIINIKELFGVREKPHFLKGKAMSELPSLKNAYLQIEGETIVDYGEMKNIHPALRKIDPSVIDATGRFVMPAWCDSHTHIVYAGSRESEFVDKIKGLTYEEIAQRGGGILNSAKRLNDTSEGELFRQSWKRLQEVRSLGTGAIEIKSGYGLTVEGELKMLRVIKKLKAQSDLLIKSTFLAHTYPLEFRTEHQAYIRLITHELLPIIEREKLADYIDVFCENGFFSVAETQQILEAGKRFGLKAKIHANQLSNSGGVQVAVKNDAVSADHLECLGDAEIACLKNSNTIPTLLPTAAFFLRLPYQPARKMIDAGLGVTLATDYNPGSSPSGNMPFLVALSCIQLRMTPEEAINAATLNGACAMELDPSVGSITRGKIANLIITKSMPSLAFLPYSFGNNLIEKVIIKGVTTQP